MVLFLVYASAIAGLLWYTLACSPYLNLQQAFGFAINVVEFGLLSLLSFLAYRQEKHFRSVFFQFWIMFASVAVTSPLVAISANLGGAAAAMAVYVRLIVVIHALFLWVAAKILLTYIFHEEKRWAINALSGLVVIPTSAWLFSAYFISPDLLTKLPTAVSADSFYNPVLTRAIISNSISLLTLVAFFLHKLRTDRPIGVFADTLLFLIGLMYLLDTGEMVLKATSMELLNITQIGLSLIAAAAIVTLLLRLKYKSQTIANYYESQLLSVNPDVGRRIGLFDRFILRSFFDPEKVGKRIYLGTGGAKVTVKRSPSRVVHWDTKN